MSDASPSLSTGAAVFLSYAREDTAAAQRIAEALRAAGVEVWFDQSELRGGDAWDQKIRQQIKECALFLPVISAKTQSRHEGYFRLEWRLADQRTHLMGKSRPFLVPVCIDATRDGDADVPDSFLAVQWTRLANGEANNAFCERVKTLLGGKVAPVSDRRSELSEAPNAGQRPALLRKRSSRPWLTALIIGVPLVAGLVLAWRVLPHRSNEPAALASMQTVATSAAPLTKAQQLIAQAEALYEPWDLATADDLKLADRLLKEATDLEPLNAEGWATLSILCFAQQSFGFDRTDARKELLRTCAERAAKLAPDARLAKLALALRYRVVSTTSDDALRLLRELAARPDADKLTLRQLGSALRDRREIAEALACYDRAAALPGGDPVALYLRGFVLRNQGQFDQAEAAFDQALALRPDFAVACYQKLLHLITFNLDLEGAKATVQKMPVRLLEDERVAAITAFVWYSAREADRAAEALQHITKDFIDAGVITGPKGLFAGLIHHLAKRDAAAAAEWRGALRVIEQRLAQDATAPSSLAIKAHLHALLGERTEAEATLRLFEQVSRLPAGRATVDTVTTYAGLGREDVVADFIAEFLKNGPRRRESRTGLFLRFSPELDPLRSQPRIQALMAEGERLLAAARPSAAEPSAAPAPADQRSAPADKSIAVLAFANFGGDRENEYFSDGITEELLNVLAKVPGLRVAARTSAFYFKDKNVPIPDIAQKLNVAYVVEGSVQKSGTRVKITAQLIKAADGFQLWSQTFTQELKDVFAMQDEIAGLIAKQLSLKLGASSAVATASVSPEAFELYLQAREGWRSRTTASLARAEELLNRALGLEPNFARAHAALADVWLVQGQNADTISRFSQRDAPAQQRLVAKAQQAIALDPDAAEAHSSLGACLWIGWRRTEAERELRRALALNPSYASAHHFLGRVLMDEGRVDESLAEFKLAVEHDPLSSRIADNYGSVLAGAGRNREALAVYERAHQLQPENIQAEFFRAILLVSMGRNEEGLAIVRDWPEQDGDKGFPKAVVLGLAGQHERAAALVSAPRLQRFVDPINRFVLESPEQALAKLDPSAARSINVSGVLFGTNLDPFRDDPRFVRYIDAIGLTEANVRAQAWRKAHPPEKPEAKK